MELIAIWFFVLVFMKICRYLLKFLACLSCSVICTIAYSETITYGPGDLTTSVNVRGASGGVANDHVIIGNTDVATPGTSFYLELGTLTVDGSAGPIRFESSGVTDNSTSIYMLSRTYGATALDIKGYNQVSFHITDAYTSNVPTYAIFIRGRELMEGRDYVGVIDGISVLTEANAAQGMLFSDTTVKITNTDITTTGSNVVNASRGNHAANGIFLQYGAVATIADSTITTSGDNSTGLYSASSGIEADRLKIITSGDNAYGVYHGVFDAAYSKNSQFRESIIETSGDGAVGVLSLSSSETSLETNKAVYDKTEITTTGAGAHGAAVSGENLQLQFVNGTTVVAEGAGSYGLYAAKNSEITVDSSNVESKLDAAITASLGGAVIVNESTVKGTVGILVTDEQLHDSHTSASKGSSVTVSGGTLTSTSGPAILVDKKNAATEDTISARIVLDNGATVVSSNGVILHNNAVKSDIALEVANGTSISGLITTAADATAVTSLHVDATSSWTMEGASSLTDFTLSGSLVVDGTISLDGTMDFAGGGDVDWINGSLILSDVFSAGIAGGKTEFTFSSYYQGMYVVIAEYAGLDGTMGAGPDANDYFTCGQGEGTFLFTSGNELVYMSTSAIPEPSTAVLAMGAFIIAGGVVRRRNAARCQ